LIGGTYDFIVVDDDLPDDISGREVLKNSIEFYEQVKRLVA
jgi:hypothetical protein